VEIVSLSQPLEVQMADEQNVLSIARMDQDAAGRITGGTMLYPPERAGEVLTLKAAKDFYEDASDGFDIEQAGNVYYITPLFGSDEKIDVDSTGDEQADIGAILTAIEPLLAGVSGMGDRKAVIYKLQVS
jgi:hypothetical protein